MPISRSDSHAFAFSSIQRTASRRDTKPGMCSRLPCGQTTRTYHPCADDKLRASKAGFESCPNMIRPASNGDAGFAPATRFNADITMDRVDSSNVEPDIFSISHQVPHIMTRRSAPRKNDKAIANASRHRLPFLK